MPAVSGPVTALPAVAATVRSTGRFSRTRAASCPPTAPCAALTARDESLCTASVVALTSCPLRNRKSNAERTAVRLLPSEKRCARASGESSSPAVRKTTASVAVLQSSFSFTPPKRPLMRSFRNPGACAEASPPEAHQNGVVHEADFPPGLNCPYAAHLSSRFFNRTFHFSIRAAISSGSVSPPGFPAAAGNFPEPAARSRPLSSSALTGF